MAAADEAELAAGCTVVRGSHTRYDVSWEACSLCGAAWQSPYVRDNPAREVCATLSRTPQHDNSPVRYKGWKCIDYDTQKRVLRVQPFTCGRCCSSVSVKMAWERDDA